MKKLSVLEHVKKILKKGVNTKSNILKSALNSTKEKTNMNNINGNDYASKSSFYQRIGIKLFTALFIPVVLLIAYGIISYNKSQSAIIKNYETSASDTISAVSDYMDFALSVADHKSVEYQLNSELGEYFNYNSKDRLKLLEASRVITDKLMVDKTTNTFISDIYMFGSNGAGLNINVDADFYSSFQKSDLAEKIDNSKGKSIWIGEHKILDDALSKNGKTYGTNDYALSIIRAMDYKNGYIIIDISNQQIKKIFSKYNMGEESITGFITDDGREITANSDEKIIFVNTSFYQNALKGKNSKSHSYVKYNGKEYLFIYSRLNETNAAVCSLIPKSTIIKQVKDIRNLNVLFIVFACLIAAIIGTFITVGFTKAINRLRASVLQAANGDLTTKFDTKRKDEFLILSNGIGNMVDNMRKLIGEALEVGHRVSKSAEDLSGTSKELLTATKDISLTMDNTQQGVVQQANDTESCLIQMTGLSDQINNVYKNAYEIERIADNTKSIAGEGIVMISELADKSKATSDITQSVIKKVQEFELQSESIKSFVNTINDIASQTNLLSLNASIEAARAGIYGQGFAVVASEIRKLADQSVEAVGQIQKIVKEIQNQTIDTVNTAKEAEIIVESQTESLDNTVRVFNNINEHVKKLVNNLDSISSGIKMIETAKEDTLMAIESISAVSEETAASTEEMSATTLNQIDSVERLSLEALELETEAKRLEKAINIFKIN